MKAVFVAFVLAFGTLLATAQGTFDFTVVLNGAKVVPPSPTEADGTGTLTLDRNNLSYSIRTDYRPDWRGAFYGPAEPDANGPRLYALTGGYCEAPLPVPGGTGYCLWQNSLSFTDDQRNDLLNGLWYVQVTDPIFPEFAIRGQIVLVPEPSPALVICLTAFAVFASRGSKSRQPRSLQRLD
jgi:hypothetical protein